MFANGLGWTHLSIVIAAFVLLFGTKRLPDSARSLGKSLKIFKAELTASGDGDTAAERQQTPEDPAQPAQPTSQQLAQRRATPGA